MHMYMYILCGQVSWHWRSIVELDQLWMPKCLRLGWCINFSPTPFEQGVWKRHYIQTVQELRLASLQVWRSHQWSAQKGNDETFIKSVVHLQTASSQQQSVAPAAVSRRHEDPEVKTEVALLREQRAASSTLPPGGVSRKKQPTAPPPWRDSDRHPKDTLRFNYLDNLEATGQDLRA